MTDYAPNWTPRIRVHYTAVGKQHTQLWRMSRTEGDPDILDYVTKISAFYDALAPSLYNDTVINSAEFAPVDSDVFLPCTAPEISATMAGTGGRPQNAASMAITYVGRAITGPKWKMSMYGIAIAGNENQAGDWTVLPGENAGVAASLVALTELAPTVKAIDGASVSVYDLVRLKYNDYWVRKLRG